MAATQEKSLSQFPTAAQILLTTLLFGSVVDATSTSGYDSVKILVSDLAEAILGDFAYTQDLATDAKTIFGAINSIRVLSGTATPNDADGANGQIYVKYASADYSVVALYVKLNNAWREISTGGGGGSSYVELTQAEYDAMEQAGTIDPTVMYFITDGQSGGSSTLAGLSDVNLTNPTDGQLLRYNGTSGKWENAGIINDTTASASSVYSSNKVNTELALKANKSDVDKSTITITRKSGVPNTVPLPTVVRRGHVVIIGFAHELPAGTYTAANQGGTWQISPNPIFQVFSMVSCAGTSAITVRSDGTIGFNGNITLNTTTYAIGQLVYITAD